MKNPLNFFQQRSGGRFPSLYKAMAEMENEMDRILHASAVKWPEQVETFAFSPTCNFKENEKEYVIQFDVPGVKKEDVKIELQNNRVTIRGERKEEKEEKDAKSYLSESYYGSFMRSFALPAEIDENKVDAEYADGVLTIKIPKLAGAKPKEIKVH